MGEESNMQSWIRKGNKRKRNEENKKTNRKIHFEKFELFMYLVAVLSIMTVAVLFIAVFVLKESDWIIAILSALMLAVSIFIRKMNPYTSFVVLMLTFIGTIYLIALTVINKVTPEINENISRIVSAACLGITFIIEMIHSYKGMKKISNEKVNSLEDKIK